MINQYMGNYDVEIVNKMTFLLYSETWTRLITWLHCLDCEIKIWNNTIVWNGRCTCMTSIVICLSTLIHVYQGKCWPDTLRVTSLPCRWSCLKLFETHHLHVWLHRKRGGGAILHIRSNLVKCFDIPVMYLSWYQVIFGHFGSCENKFQTLNFCWKKKNTWQVHVHLIIIQI